MNDEVIVLIGAGSASFTRGLISDIVRKNWQGELRLVDTDPEALKVAQGLAERMLDAAKSKLKLSASIDRKQVLRGATVVVCTIGVGGRRAWEQDVFIPRKYGIFQPVGDTIMPGGTSRALRMIPAMVDIARDVSDLAPDALFFNYGNPMSAVCRGVIKVTGVKMVGLCHGVPDVARSLAGFLGVDASSLIYTAGGINHFTWFTEISSKGQDLLPKLMSIARDIVDQFKVVIEKHSGSPAKAEISAYDNSFDGIRHPFTWKLTLLTGAYPAVFDRHVIEFFPGLFSREASYFGRTPGIDAYSFENTIENGDLGFIEMTAVAEGRAKVPDHYLEQSEGEHEQVVDIIQNIRADSGVGFSANLPNAGQLPEIPDGPVVECPCVATKSGLVPSSKVALTPFTAGLLAPKFQWAETVSDAALSGNRDLVVQALVLDGSVPDIDTAVSLANELIEAQIQYLPAFSS
jgi:alpha-galactosidase